MNYIDYYRKARLQFSNHFRTVEDVLNLDCLRLGIVDVHTVAAQIGMWMDKQPKTNELSIPYKGDIFNDLDLNHVARQIMPDVENFYGCNLFVDKVYIYRNVYQDIEKSSWLWHYDNNPPTVYKIMIYLCDVGEGNAPFQYVENMLNEPSRTGTDKWEKAKHGSRVDPATVRQNNIRTVFGPKGFSFLQNPNCTHRATVPFIGSHRDVLTLRVRPTIEPMFPYVSPEHTTDFKYDGTVPQNPEQKKTDKLVG